MFKIIRRANGLSVVIRKNGKRIGEIIPHYEKGQIKLAIDLPISYELVIEKDTKHENSSNME